MRIAYFTDTYLPEVNGVTNTLKQLTLYLEQRNTEHIFFAPDYDGGGKSCAAGNRVRRFPGIRVSLSPNSCLAFPRAKTIFDLCDEFTPDLVHVTTEFGIGYRGMKYALSRRLPLVMSCHTDYCNYLSFFNLGSLENMADLYLKWFYRFSQKTLVPSRSTLEQLLRKGYQNLGIWSRGIDVGSFHPELRSATLREKLGIGDRFAFLYVGRLSPEKGLHMLLQAIPAINSRFPNKAVFVFTGDGPYADTIRQAGFDNVILTGFRSGRELSQIYASCDCFAFPSGTETFGNAPLEALASGLPVAGINSGGVTDFLSHGENALLSPAGDSNAFADHLIRLMEDPALRITLSQGGLRTARSRDWKFIFDGLMAQYEALLQQKSLAKRVHAS